MKTLLMKTRLNNIDDNNLKKNAETILNKLYYINQFYRIVVVSLLPVICTIGKNSYVGQTLDLVIEKAKQMKHGCLCPYGRKRFQKHLSHVSHIVPQIVCGMETPLWFSVAIPKKF